MNKLIKLAPDHFVVVEDSPLTEPYPKIVLEKLTTGKWTLFQIDTLNDVDSENQRRITHSTQPLSDKPHYAEYGMLTLPEVEEAINGYGVEKMAEDKGFYDSTEDNKGNKTTKAFIEGFNAHKELVKDKLFNNIDIRVAISLAYDCGKENKATLKQCYDSIIQTISPPIEWNVKFDEQGKIIII